MSAKKLAFLENFYTDVTLYLPTEPVAPAAGLAVPEPGPLAEAAPVAPLKAVPAALPARPAAAAGAPASRLSTQPSTAFARPSAGLERLIARELVPVAPAEPEITAASTAGVAIAPVLPGVPPAMLTPFSVLGSNRQGVALLFRMPHEQFLRLHRNVFLNKMLQALGYVMADVLLINVESELPVTLANLRKELAAAHIIAFGKNLLDVTIRNTQIYEPVQFPSLGLAYLASATVDLVEYDVSLKKRLWPGLQRMFGKA